MYNFFFQASPGTRFFQFTWSFWIIQIRIRLQRFWSWSTRWSGFGLYWRSRSFVSYAKRNLKVAGCIWTGTGTQCSQDLWWWKKKFVKLKVFLKYILEILGDIIANIRTRFFKPSLEKKNLNLSMDEKVKKKSKIKSLW